MAEKPDAVPTLAKLIDEAFKRHPEQAKASKLLKMISEIARQNAKGYVPHDAMAYKSTFNENLQTLHKKGQDPGNRDDIAKMEAVIDAFFSPDGFFKRLALHKAFVC